MRIAMHYPVRCCALCLVAVATAVSAASLPGQQPPQPQADNAENDTVPVTLTLTKECGADRKYVLADVSARPYAWCNNAITLMDGTIEPTSALVSRVLTVAVDVETADDQAVPVQLFVMTFDAAWTPRTQTRVAQSVAKGRLQARVYVPADAKHIGLTLSGISDAQALLHIRRVTARPGDRPVAPGMMCVPCQAYLDGALQQVRTHFLFIDRLPMDDVAQALRLNATGASSVAELDDVLKQLSMRMNDAERASGAYTHSHYLTRAEREAMAAAVPTKGQGAARQDGGLPPRHDSSPYFDTRLLGGRVGYVRLRGFFSQDQAQSQAYAHGLLGAVTELHHQGARRWVIDLRLHTGGNMWPALAGLRPLLGTGDLGYLVDAAGHRKQIWNYDAANGSAGAPLFAGPAPGFDATVEPTAVLLGEMTGSSGEMLAISFQGRDQTRSFGAPTFGATTSIYSAPDPYGNTLGIAWTYVADRNGRKVYPRVTPDIAIHPNARGSADETLDSALAWLATQQ
jgi:carboxyl-terminal processing protease